MIPKDVSHHRTLANRPPLRPIAWLPKARRRIDSTAWHSACLEDSRCTLLPPPRLIPTLGFAISCLTALALTASPVWAQVPDKAASVCIVSVNKTAALLAKAHSKLASGCAKAVTKGTESDFADCVETDAKGKIGAAEGVVAKKDAAKCSVLPPFGYGSPADISYGADLAVAGLVAELIGDHPTSLLASAEKADSVCQGIVLKQSAGLLAARLRAFTSCKKAAMKAATLASAGDLENTCFDALLADDDGKLGKADDKLGVLVGKKCATSDLSLVFPGSCSGAGDFPACVTDRSECAACRLLNNADGLARDCDLFDDGLTNNSCSTCGNGIVELGEDCDAGDSEGTQCCSAQCTAIAEAASCDDGDACTQVDTCLAGVCTGADPVVCTALDQCHSVGICDTETGLCPDPLADNGTVCDDGDACTTLDVCTDGTCAGTVVPPAETLLSDDFDDSTLDPAWNITFSGVATNWTFAEAGTDLTVTGITNSTTNQWGTIDLERDVAPTQDFRLSIDLGWDSLGSNVPIQEVYVEGLDSNGDRVVYAGFIDAWAASSGGYAWAACPSGCSGSESQNTRPPAGSGAFVIERVSDQVLIKAGATTLFDATGDTSEITAIRLHFGHWKWSGAGGSPTFGSENIDLVTFEAVNVACGG